LLQPQVPCLEKLAREIPELGILTTKSIGPEPRAGNREPILGQYIPGGFINAVGLTNPGVEEFARELSQSSFPQDKFLLASIFGKNAGEFVDVARHLEKDVDGFELNLSCPHAKGYGMQLGQDPETVEEITREVVNITEKPIFAKLTPNVRDIGKIAQAAVGAGARGLVAINTVGPGYYSVDGISVLTNKVGGLSGTGIAPIGLKCVRDIRQAVGDEPLIIGMAGIRTTRDALESFYAGSDAVGIGSGLAGMTDENLIGYFSHLVEDIKNNGKTNNSSAFLQEVDMTYQKVRVKRTLNSDCDFRIARTDTSIDALPGQFVFAWLPGGDEKPFSIMDNDPLTLGVLERGEFTRQFNQLQKGDCFYVRGPYGQGVDVPENSDVVLVSGGCGSAGLYLHAKRFSEKSNITTLLAAKDKKHIAYLEKFERYGKVEVVTEDGSLGRKGLVTDLIGDLDLRDGSYFFNCGPKAMVDGVLPLELEVSNGERIYSSVDYMTRCGVGICGSCSDKTGRRTCVEGPFMSL